MIRKSTLAALILLVSNGLFAQDGVKSTISDNKGNASFVEFDTKKVQHSLRNAGNALKGALGLQADDEFRKVKGETDELGYIHEKHQQYYKGIKVEHGTYMVHAKKDGIIEKANGEFHHIRSLNTTPSLSAKAALAAAMKFVGATTYKWQIAEEEAWLKQTENNKAATFYPTPELIVCQNYYKNDGSYTLAYKLDVYAQEPLSRDFIYVNANTGEIIYKEPIIKHVGATGSGATRYSGTQSIQTDSFSGSHRLREVTRGLGIETYNMKKGTNYSTAVDFTDVDNNWTSAEFNNTNKDNAALDAHWGASMTYDYFKLKHNSNMGDIL